MTSVRRSKRSAFTLIELMIVIVIMGLVYALVSFKFGTTKKELPPLSLETLPQTMHATFTGEARSFIIYGDQCELFAFVPPLENYELNDLAFSDDLKVYTFNAYGSLQLKEFGTVRVEYSDIPVCFKYEIFPNKSTSHMIVQSGKFFYYMPAFSLEVERFATMPEAQTAMLHAQLNPHELYIERN